MRGEAHNIAEGKSVTVIGAGNIGSQLLGHLARMPAIGRIVVADPDFFTSGNLVAQEMSRSDVGAAKAISASRRMRRIRPELEVTPIVDRVENVPWGRLRSDVICGCVDSKAARAAINLIARRLGTTYVDAGIREDGLLARVDVYSAGADDPCLECGFGQKDYEAMGQTYSCTGEVREAPSTGASSALGGLAAAVQAMECAKLLDTGSPAGQAGRQVVIEAARHHLFVNLLRRNPQCRFDHRVCPIRKATAATLGELSVAGATIRRGVPAAISVETKSWVTRLACRECGEQAPALVLQGRMSPRLVRCRCGGQRDAVGFHMLPRLELSTSRPRLLRTPPGRVGLRAGDVVRLSGADFEECIELMGDAE